MGVRGRPLDAECPGRARAGSWRDRWHQRPAGAGTGPGRPTPSSGRPGRGHGWPRPDGCAATGRPPGTSGGRTRPPAAPVRTRAGRRRGHAEPQGVRPGRRPPRPRWRDGRPSPSGRSPGHRGRRGPTHSWSAAGPHRRPGQRCGRRGGPAVPHCRGGGPRTSAGTRPPMLRPASPARLNRRRTSGLGTRRGRTDTADGRWPARGCSTPPAPPRAWRYRPPPAAALPLRWRERTHPWCIAVLRKWFGDESRPEVGVRKAIARSKRTWIFLGEKRSAIVGSRVWQEPWTADRCRHGWRAQERWD
jgi:hypothetical protein